MAVDRSVEIVVRAPAKLNLYLEVLGRRNDGYHDVETLMVPVSLCDVLTFRDSPEEQVLLSLDWGASKAADDSVGGLPAGAENLVVRAVELLRRRFAVGRGARMRLLKRVPWGSGLGGGSSDAAAALRAANSAWGLGLCEAELSPLAAELGSDVPFFLRPGAAVCRGRGEVIEPLPPIGRLDGVLVRPPHGLSTAAVYAAAGGAAGPAGGVGPLVDALRRGDRRRAGRLLFNRLLPAAARLSPWIERTFRALEAEDCWGRTMTGSGTCCFGLCAHWRHARRVAKRLQRGGVGRAMAVHTGP